MTRSVSEQGLDEAQGRELAFLRIGSICAVTGTVGYLIAFLLHGDLPDQSTQSVLSYIATRPWALHHLAIVLCFLLWLAALSGLSHSLAGGTAWVLGRLGQLSAVLGTVVLLWHYNIDGPALEQVADGWVAASGAERAVLLERGTVLITATTGMFPLYVALLLGLPFVLFGAAVVASRNYPSWLGWVGVAAGGLGFVVGASNFAGLDLLPMNLFVLTVLVVDFWMLAIGRLMWRRAAMPVTAG